GAIPNAKPVAWRPHDNGEPVYFAQPAWPARDKPKIDSIVREGFGLYDLWETSPVRYETPSEPSVDLEGDPVWITTTVTLEKLGPFAEEIVDYLFPYNPLLCVGK